MERQEAGRVRLLAEAVDLQRVRLVLDVAVAEGHLLLERLAAQRLHRLEVRVERVDHSQRHLQQVLDDVADGDVVGQPDAVADGHELADARDRQHLERQRAADAEPGAAGREHERDLLVRGPRVLLRRENGAEFRRVPSSRPPGGTYVVHVDLQRRGDARLPQIPVLRRAVVVQQLHQVRYVHVVVVVEMAEPPETAKRNKK